MFGCLCVWVFGCLGVYVFMCLCVYVIGVDFSYEGANIDKLVEECQII